MRMTLRLVSVALLLSTSSALAFDTSKLIQFGSLPLDDFTPIITKSRVASSLVGYRLRLLGLRDAAPHPSRYSGPRDLAFNRTDRDRTPRVLPGRSQLRMLRCDRRDSIERQIPICQQQ